MRAVAINKAVLRYVMALLFLLLSASLFAQVPEVENPKTENQIEKLVETIAEANEEEDVDYVTLLDALTYYAENPLNLNTATKEELLDLQLIDELQVNNLMAHIDKHGKLMHINELQTIDGFDFQIIRRIQPFVKVTTDFERPKITFKELFKNGKNEVFLRYQQYLEEQAGYASIDDSSLAESPNSRYLGSPAKIYARYRFTYSTHVSWGITGEKDSGEEFFKGSQKRGFDFYSAHFYLKNIGKLKALALGDYQAQFGQGLTLWTGLAFGKTADGTSIKRNAGGLRPYASADENRFLRGAGTTWAIGSFEVTGFYSNKKIDGNISEVDTSNNEVLVITSFQEGGYHRTPAELEDRKSVRQTMYGGRLAFIKRKFNIGVTGVQYQFSSRLEKSDNLYNINEFSGDKNANYGVDFNYVVRNFNLFGEASMSQNGSYAYIAGALISLDPKLTLTILNRNIKPDYQNLYANAVTENSRIINEKGTYIGITSTPLKSWIFSGYVDIFKFPWLRFSVNAPSWGYEYLGQLTYKPSKVLEIYGRIRQQDKMENAVGDEPTIKALVHERQTNYRLNVTYKISQSIKLRNRVEFVNYKKADNKPETGFLIYQDVYYQAIGSPVSFSFRYALFDTETYNARLYAYENDVLYAFSIPAYYYKGSRTYLTLRYKPVRGIDIWLRYAVTFLNNRNVISSGLTEIQGSVRSEIKAQVRFKF